MQAGITTFCDEKSVARRNQHPTSAIASEDEPATAKATSQAISAQDLPTLNLEKNNFALSSLKKTATHTILGVGPLHPKLMCVLDMPDSDSDRAGVPLAGPQAELLKKMMVAIHLDITKDVYVTYLSPWRTPGNRVLTQAESALFLPFITKEIQLVQPQKLLLFGASVANCLLKVDSISKARGHWHTFQEVPTRVTLSLSSLKTTPLRQQAWQDLQEVEKL